MSTSLQELKKTKPKYPETTMGTHCMGDNWTVCCPYKHPVYDRYHQTKLVIQIYYRGGIYRVYVCTDKCAKNIKRLAFKQPDKFKKMFIKSIKPNGDMILKHYITGETIQIAKKMDTYEEKKKSSSKTNKKTKQTGGSRYRRTHKYNHKKYIKRYSSNTTMKRRK
jgi:hypothetical protein